MTDIEILYTELLNNQTPLHCTRKELCDAVDRASAALQEKEKREKGCKYCKVPGKYLATIDYDGAETRLFFDVVGNSLRVFDEEMPGLCDSFSISFCPMCGRKMVQI